MIMPATSISMKDLADLFNQAFSDYFIEVYFTERSLKEYVVRHGLDMGRSMVVEEQGLLVGLLLCGSDDTTTWNAGMGIHPRWRRRGLGRKLLDAWLTASKKAGLRQALLEVIVQNLVALNLYRSRAFRHVRAYQGFEGRPGWQRVSAIHTDHVNQVKPTELTPVYRKGHSWQKRLDVLRRLEGFTALRTVEGTPEGFGYLIYENNAGLYYIFDCTPNRAGRALLEHTLRRESPRLLRVVNTIDLVEEDFYRRLGFRPWIRNLEMVTRL
jgi:ribosomal protein S18 acetylase RimI-like enzyme